MQNTSKQTIYAIRASAHHSALAALQPVSLPKKKTYLSKDMAVATILPLLLLGNIVLLTQNPPGHTSEALHGAAPEDTSIAEQKEMTEFFCNEICTADKVASADEKLLQNFCYETCGVQLQTKVSVTTQEIVVPKVPVVQKQTAVEVSGNAKPQITSVDTQKPENSIAMYLTPNSVSNSDKLSSTLDRTFESGGNAVFIDVKGSYVYFHSDAQLADEYSLIRPMYDLPKIIEQAHQKNMVVIGRYIAVKDPSLARAAPQAQIENVYTKRGIGDVWVTANHPDVLAYNRQILEDLVESGIDEINFDYIRYPTEYNQAAINLSGEQKADKLMEFLQMARTVVEEKNADTILGVSTFAILGWNFPINFEPLGQDIARFAEVVDIISPMAYPSTFSAGAYYNPAKNKGSRNYHLVYRTLEGYQELLGDNAYKLRPWIQGYFMNQKGLQDQMQAVYDAGICGFSIWSAQNYYDEAYKALQRADRPEKCS